MQGQLTATTRPVEVDIVLLADVRQGDLASPCHAAAAEALAGGGYSLALVPVLSGIAADPFTIDPAFAALRARDMLRWVSPDARVRASLALAFDARIFEQRWMRGPQIEADHRVVTVERPAALTALSPRAQRVLEAQAEQILGGPVLWAPNAPLARDALLHAAPDWATTDTDWAPVAPRIEAAPPDAAERARPVIGRGRIARSRPQECWADNLLASNLVAVRDRRAPGPAPAPAWPHPAPVELWPDDRLSLAELFPKIDILANTDHADDDPVPVEALMALAAGVIPYLAEPYREQFGGAALYGAPSQLAEAAIAQKLDPSLGSAARRAGANLLAELFAPERFTAAVSALIGPPSGQRFAPHVHTQPPCRVIFYSTNGVGMGHLTRQLALATRLPACVEPVFLSHSRAVGVVREYGYMAEHLPYHAHFGQARKHWNQGVHDTLLTAFGFYQPQAIVFDGNVPFAGLLSALSLRGEVKSVWVRRAMWGPGRDTQALERADAFDLVIEPQDPAWARDIGPTVAHEGSVRQVPPVRLLDPGAQMSREEACAKLGLDPGATNVLIATGAGNNFEMAEITRAALSQLSGRAQLGVALARWRIAETPIDPPPGAALVTDYPFAATHAAFDAAIAAPGYNTYVEHLAAALPTIWIPNENEQMDQQIARATDADARRLGILVRSCEPFRLTQALERMLNPPERQAMAARGVRYAADVLSVNGAQVAADLVADLALQSLSRPEVPG